MANITNISNMTETEIYDLMVSLYAETNGDFVLMTHTGELAHIVAQTYTGDFVEDHEKCDWFWVYGVQVDMANSSLRRIARDLARYAELLEEETHCHEQVFELEAKLAAFEDKTCEEYMELFDFYSDVHKDAFGFRPRTRP